MLEKRTRRKFAVEYKLKIVTQANACKHGELGALLRKEKLYSNQLADWRKAPIRLHSQFDITPIPGKKSKSPVELPIRFAIACELLKQNFLPHEARDVPDLGITQEIKISFITMTYEIARPLRMG